MGNCKSTIIVCHLCTEPITIQDNQYLMCNICNTMYHYKCAYNKTIFLDNCIYCGVGYNEIKNKSMKSSQNYRNSV